jgi:hypothetical protein
MYVFWSQGPGKQVYSICHSRAAQKRVLVFVCILGHAGCSSRHTRHCARLWGRREVIGDGSAGAILQGAVIPQGKLTLTTSVEHLTVREEKCLGQSYLPCPPPTIPLPPVQHSSHQLVLWLHLLIHGTNWTTTLQWPHAHNATVKFRVSSVSITPNPGLTWKKENPATHEYYGRSKAYSWLWP